MSCITVVHRTTYSYATPVAINPHRLMMRPREGPALHLLSFHLDIEPASIVSWAEDVFGNAIATATFNGRHRELHFVGTSQVEVLTSAWPVFDIAATAISFPFRYSDEEMAELGSLLEFDPDSAVTAWARSFVAAPVTDTLSLLKDINSGFVAMLKYEIREDEGTQAPAETLRIGSGSCRDFAELFTQAVRSIGFGSRVVSGYLYDAGLLGVEARGGAASHAWSDVYIPGAGWIAFDPTNATTGGAHLIPVAVGTRMQRLVPVAGSYGGPREAYLGMTVSVDVSASGAAPGR